MNDTIQITDDTITINLIFFIHRDYAITTTELLVDVFYKMYKPGMKVIFRAGDGENVNRSGFLNFVIQLAMQFNIPHELITFETHGRGLIGFKHRKLVPGLFCVAGSHIPSNFDRDVSSAKFIGTTIGRYSPTRFRLVYEMDKAFPNDNFMVFQPTPAHVRNNLFYCPDLYKDELEWVSNKTFDKDIPNEHSFGMIGWQDSCSKYGNIWNKFQIEVISETDADSDYWFTEKTGRCIATGKPFVILAGQGSLRKLKEMGFKTYGDIIDESYDMEITPQTRIKGFLNSLKTLYFDENKALKLQKMHEIAQENIDIYNYYKSNTKEENDPIQI